MRGASPGVMPVISTSTSRIAASISSQSRAGRGAIIGPRRGGAGGVGGIVPSHRREQDGAILGAPGERADMVERIGEGEDAVAADAAIGRLQPGDAAIGGGQADGAAG